MLKNLQNWICACNLGLRLSLDILGDRLQEAHRVKRFCEVIIGTEILGFLTVEIIIAGGEHYEG